MQGHKEERETERERRKTKKGGIALDGLLKNRQTITYLNTNLNKLIATGNKYDHEGRLCITGLPTPSPVPSFQYQYNLLLNAATNLPYNAADFDTSPLHLGVISPLASTSLVNVYYPVYRSM